MSERVFRVGQRVRIVWSPAKPDRLGMVTTVTSDLHPIRYCKGEPTGYRSGWRDYLPRGTLVHDVDIPASQAGVVVAYPPNALEPYDDGREPAEWTTELRKLCRVKGRVNS